MAEFMSLDPRGQGKVSWLTKGGLCGDEDCTILSARVGVAYEDGKEATPDTGVSSKSYLLYPCIPQVRHFLL